MNKRDIIEKIALEQELPNSETAKYIDDVLLTLVDSIIEGNGSEIRGFGTFTKKNRKPRTGINPKLRKEHKFLENLYHFLKQVNC